MSSVLIVTSQIEEADAVIEAFRHSGARSVETSVGRMVCAGFPDLDVLVAVGGNGKAQFAVQAQYLLDRCPDATLLACVGAAGALASDVTLGDVVVATVTVEHDFKERFVPEPLPRHDGDRHCLDELRRVVHSTALPFTVHFGPIASGDEDIVDRARAAEIRIATSALCVAWEGAGGARAARFSRVPFLEIRAITDAADEHAATAFRDSVKRAGWNAAQLLLAWRASKV